MSRKFSSFMLLLCICALFIENSTAARSESVAPLTSTSLQASLDGNDGMALLGVSAQILDAPLAMIRGDNVKAQAVLQSALAETEAFLAKNPQSPTGHFVRGNIKNMRQDKSGQADLERTIQIVTERMQAEPNYIGNYRLRGDAYSALGRKDAAIADYKKALTLTSNLEESNNLEKKLRRLLESK